jgi:hypothetical protein
MKHGCNFKHGYAKPGAGRPNIYRRWQHMIQRCHNPNDRDYARYGAKGVYVCDRWRFGEGDTSGFELFLSDMGGAPSRSMSIDRVDVTGPYAPGNCRWADATQQARNRRNTKYLTAFGETKPQQEWCDLYGISHQAFVHRLKTGLSVEDALTKPVKSYRKETPSCL